MKKVFLLLLAIMAVTYFGAKAQNAEKPFVHCLVLDKTASMEGKIAKGIFRPEENIWNSVKNYCYDWVDNISVSQPTIVLLFTYDEDLSAPQTFIINSTDDKAVIKESIRVIEASGQHTHIATSFEKTMKYLRDNYEQNKKRIYLITDGRDEEAPGRFASVIHNYDSWRGDFDYLYFVDINDQATPDVRKAIEESPNAEIGKGLTEFVTLSPDFKTISHEIKQNRLDERSFNVTQLFSVTNGKMNDALSIKANIPDNSVENTNLSIRIAKANINNNGKYEVEFVVNVISNTNLQDCIIPVNITGSQAKVDGNDLQLNVEPSSFNIKVTKEHIEPVVIEHQKIETSGWD